MNIPKATKNSPATYYVDTINGRETWHKYCHEKIVRISKKELQYISKSYESIKQYLTVKHGFNPELDDMIMKDDRFVDYIHIIIRTYTYNKGNVEKVPTDMYIPHLPDIDFMTKNDKLFNDKLYHDEYEMHKMKLIKKNARNSISNSKTRRTSHRTSVF